jgi:hypothetical protein
MTMNSQYELCHELAIELQGKLNIITKMRDAAIARAEAAEALALKLEPLVRDYDTLLRDNQRIEEQRGKAEVKLEEVDAVLAYMDAAIHSDHALCDTFSRVHKMLAVALVIPGPSLAARVEAVRDKLISTLQVPTSLDANYNKGYQAAREDWLTELKAALASPGPSLRDYKPVYSSEVERDLDENYE